MEVCFIFLLKGGTEFLSIIEVTFSLQSLYVGCVQPLVHFIQRRILCRNDMQFSYLFWC